MFKNRKEAGILLSQKVHKFLNEQPDHFSSSQIIVIGLPRGGMPIAYEIASKLNAPLTFLVSKKIGAPMQPELAIGAISSSGVFILNNELSDLTQHMSSYIETEKNRLAKATKELEEYWNNEAGIKEKFEFKDKLVILVDDGIATGMTTLAAIRSLRLANVSQIILATPVIAKDTHNWLLPECDQIISLLIPNNLNSIGQFYLDFTQVEDAEVITTLKNRLLKG